MLQIRRAAPRDVPLILALVKELAIYEREPDAVVATEADLLRDGFGDAPAFQVLLAEEDESGLPVPVGFALWFFTFSTWVGRRCLYLEDLFVRPAFRGRGAGLALMGALAREAEAAGCGRFLWQVLDWNQPAIDFYEKLGARLVPEWRTVRVEGEALATLARLAPGARAP